MIEKIPVRFIELEGDEPPAGTLYHAYDNNILDPDTPKDKLGLVIKNGKFEILYRHTDKTYHLVLVCTTKTTHIKVARSSELRTCLALKIWDENGPVEDKTSDSSMSSGWRKSAGAAKKLIEEHTREL